MLLGFLAQPLDSFRLPVPFLVHASPREFSRIHPGFGDILETGNMHGLSVTAPKPGIFGGRPPGAGVSTRRAHAASKMSVGRTVRAVPGQGMDPDGWFAAGFAADGT